MAEPLGAWRGHLVRGECIRLLMTGRGERLCQVLEYDCYISNDVDQPFWGVEELALRAGGLFGLQK